MTFGRQIAFQLAGAVLTLALLWATGALGPAGMMLVLLTPLPAAYIHLRMGAQPGVGVVLLVTLALLVSDGPQGVLVYLLQFGLGSLLLPLLLRRGLGWDRAVAATVLTTAGAGLVVLLGYALQTGRTIKDLVESYVQLELAKVMDVYQQADLTPSQLDELQGLAGRTAEFLVLAYPGLVLTGSAALLLWVVLMLVRMAQGQYAIPGPPLPQWKAPDALIWLVIAGGFGVFFGEGLLFQVALNLLVVVLPIYFLQGLAVVAHYFQRRGTAPFLRVLGYLLLVIVNPLPAIVTGIGIFDLWVDFRKPKTNKS